MNQKLLDIFNFIQQSEKLDAEQKEKLLKAVKDADKELEITAFKLERTEKVKKTTAILLEETIEELEQKRKAVEKQNRELEIEASLERVRARTMAMQKSDELKDVIKLVYEQFVQLNINIDHAGFVVDYTPKGDWHFWIADQQEIPSKITHPYFDSVWAHQFNDAKEKGIDYFATKLNREEKNKFYQEMFKHIPDLLETSKEFYFNCPGLAVSTVLSDNVGLYIENFSGTPYSDEDNKILMRFGKVFQQTYTRFLDLKKAEAQAREAQIEAALERVRSRSMGMHKSDELKDVVRLLYNEFRILVRGFDSVNIQLNLDSSKGIHFWASVEEDIYPELYHLPYSHLPIFEKIYNAFNSPGAGYLDYLSSKEEKDAFFKVIFNVQPVPPKRKKMIEDAEGMIMMGWFHKYSGIDIVRYNFNLFSEEEKEIVKRFAAAFEQTYIRFLDLQKAEAQAKEAQIEASLEKVRAVAMSMNKSDDLLSICEVSFKEFRKLGFDNLRNALIHIQYDEQKYFMDYDFSELTGGAITKIEYGSHPIVEEYLRQIRSAKDAFYQGVIKEDQLEEWKNFRRNSGQIDDPRLEKATALYYYFFSIGMGDIGISTLQPIDESQIKILKRFRNVFDLAYRRYDDIKLAEEQARETQIQLALERVRARTMAMHKSEELSETSFVLFEQLKELGEIAEQISILIYNENEKVIEIYATIYGNQWNETARLPLEESSVHKKIFTAWQERKKSLVVDLSGKDLDEFNNFKMKYSRQYKSESELPKKRWVVHNAFFSKGVLTFSTHKPRPSETIDLLERFAGVFDLTYTRFLDLKKAEAQAREAEIEAALERVRARTMAMQKSDELAETASHLFDQLNSLGIKPYRFNIAIVNPASEECQLWSTSNEGKVIPLGPLIPLREHKVFNQMYDGWKRQENISVIRIHGEDRIAWTKYIMKYVSFNEYKPENIDLEKLRSEPAIFSNFFFKQGFIVVHTIEEINDADIKIIQRFVNVFEQTYTRFLDLQKAEEQAKEAIKQAALDRIRGEIASMRTSEDLNHITPIIWRELKNLEVPFFRCGVYIVDELSEMVQVYLTTPDGKSLGVLNLAFDSNEITSNTVDHWRKKMVYKTHWDKDEFIEWTKSMMELGQIQSSETYQGSTTPPDSLYLHFVPFGQGMLYVGDIQSLNDEKLELVKTLAEAFSIAYARYEDFRNLEEAKNKIEVTLNELKAAQAQLIHSEKMASLGELTAGIAHEIKNPLNFVNNFSEVSRELLDEMQIELKNNNIEEVIELVENLKQNLDKINQHGKRADSIVKGMLLHSRGTSGEKTLTDINDLLDQYVNLAYHGMRATNKEFNISIEKDYDKSIEKINVVPQDISRVFLNIINNACYAAYDKKKKGENDFSPTLKVSTKKTNNKVEIKIRDNGNGISADHLDKIFQPFFTTKPSGEGTGLGLSLSYDIVTKVHGGEMKVETKVGEGTEFLIILNN